MERVFGRDVGILNEATKEGNRSIEELKRGTAAKHLKEIREQISEAGCALAGLQKSLLTSSEVKAVAEKGKKTLMGGLKGISYAEFGQLKMTAAAVDVANGRADQAERDAADARKELNEGKREMQAQASQLARDREKLEAEKEKTPTKQMLERNKELYRENQGLSLLLHKVRATLREVLPELKKILAPEKLERVNELIDTAKTKERGGVGR